MVLALVVLFLQHGLFGLVHCISLHVLFHSSGSIIEALDDLQSEAYLKGVGLILLKYTMFILLTGIHK